MSQRNVLNNFKDILGEYCAINQFIELSKRCFVKDHVSDLKTRDSFVNLATENAITLTSYNADQMVNTISEVILLMFIFALKHF